MNDDAVTTVRQPRHLRLVVGAAESHPSTCAMRGELAVVRSAVDDAPLCTTCFTATHWHPSWSKPFER